MGINPGERPSHARHRREVEPLPGAYGRADGRTGVSSQRPSPSHKDEALTALRMDATGVPGLDVVLGGGLPRGTLAIIVGPPGSGKTTLANQIAFETARMGRRALVLTALSEPTTKLIARLRSFRFFEERLVGEAIQFMSLEQFLPQGLNATGDELIAIARETRAGVVVLDGFRGVRGADVNPQVARQFLYDVGTTLSALGTTTVITSEADPRDPMFFPEQTTADVIVGLHYGLLGVSQHREIEAVKVRGVDPLPGLHGLKLTDRGATVYPRLEALVTASNGPGVAFDDGTEDMEALDDDLESAERGLRERRQFDLPELDALLGGGLTSGTSTLMIGSVGTGKTLLSLDFMLAGVRAGEHGMYLGFRESRRQLLHKAYAFHMGAALRDALAGGMLTLHRWAPVELNPDIVADRLLDTLDRVGARRLVVDSVAELEHAVRYSGTRDRSADYTAALIEALRARDITTLFIKEHPRVLATDLNLSTGPLSVMAENVLLLEQVEYRDTLHRVLSVLKMRFSAHDHVVREFTITSPDGIRVLTPFESGDVLAGIARLFGGERLRSPRRGRPSRARSVDTANLITTAGDGGAMTPDEDSSPEG